MKNSLLVEKSNIGKRLLAYAIDIVSVILSTLVLFFIILYGVFGTGFNYIGNNKAIEEKSEEYNLTLRYGEDYKKYEEVVKEFYFVHFKDEIIKDYSGENKTYSIEYIYNVVVLRLPETPTTEYNSTSLYRYKVNSDGSYALDILGEQVEGSGAYFERSLMDLFYQSYETLPSILRRYDSSFDKCFLDNAMYEGISRVIAFVISVLIFYILIPYINKHGATLSEKYLKIGYVNTNNYLSIKKYKIALRPLIYYLLPALTMYAFTGAGVVILGVVPLFINFVVVLLSKENKDLFEIFTKVMASDLESSNIFDNQKEADEFMKQEKIDDIDFCENLKSIDEINTNTTEVL